MVQIALAARLEANGPAAEARRREILAAASKLFRAKGLHATGMRDIAAALGVTAGSLYYYFPSKQELLAYCQEATLGQLLGLARGIRAGAGRADLQLARLISGHVRVLNEATPGSLAHLEFDAVPAARRTKLLAQRKRYELAYRRTIEAGIATGVFRPVDARLATLALLGALNWTVQWFQAEGRKSADEVGREFADLLVHGFLKSDAPPNASRAAGDERNERKAGRGERNESRAGPPAERSPRERTAGWSPRPGGRVIPAIRFCGDGEPQRNRRRRTSARRAPAKQDPRRWDE